VKRITYGGGEFLTDNAIAEALMEYASVLAIIESADVVSFPGVDDDGIVRTYELLIGPSSQIFCVSTDEPEVEMDVNAAVTEFRQRAHQRLPSATDIGDSGDRAAESDAEAVSHESN
jgi:hypothetical protein